MPVAFTSIRTSPSRGPARSSSTISSGFWAAKATAARVFMTVSGSMSASLCAAPARRSISASVSGPDAEHASECEHERRAEDQRHELDERDAQPLTLVVEEVVLRQIGAERGMPHGDLEDDELQDQPAEQ